MEQWIAFDAAGTLFEPAEPVESTYANCFSKLGYRVQESSWKSAFTKAFQITPDPDYSDHADGEALEKDWWYSIVRNSANAIGICPDPDTIMEAFEQLFAHYAKGSAWKLFPETESVLTTLKSDAAGLAVTSNFDSRLYPVLEGLGIADYFDFILTSADVGARKPSPLILHKSLELTETNPESWCLIGDSLHADGGAAKSAGIRFFHVDRPSLTLSDFAHHFRRH